MPNCTCFSSGLRWIWVTFVVVLVDHFTKILAKTYLIPYEPSPVLPVPVLNWTLSFNRGSAFSFLDAASGWQVFLFGGIALVVSVAILFWLHKISARERFVGIALALVMGGALGNLWDRIAYGQVIDFIDFYVGSIHWPAFNVADSAICIGAVMLLWDSIRKTKHQ